MAIFKSKQFHIDVELQDYPDADCKYMISIWHTPEKFESRELVAIGLTDEMPMVKSTRNRGNIVESVTKSHKLEIPNDQNN